MSSLNKILDEIFSHRPRSGATSDATLDAKPGVTKSAVEDDALELLYAYIEYELDGKDATLHFPKVHRAIQVDEAAAEQYKDLKTVLSAQRNGTLKMPATIPTFDFSYLQQEDTNDPPGSSEVLWRWNDLGQIVVEFSRPFLDAHENAIVQGDRTPAFLRTFGSEEQLIDYVIDQEHERDGVVSIKAHTSSEDKTLCDINIHVDCPQSRFGPQLADSQIYLTLPNEKQITQSTDSSGNVSFRNIPQDQLSELKLVIEPVK